MSDDGGIGVLDNRRDGHGSAGVHIPRDAVKARERVGAHRGGEDIQPPAAGQSWRVGVAA
jgi:hypothetical protein